MTNKPPAYIPIILHPLIRLAYLTPDIHAQLKASGCLLETDAAGCICVKFDDSEQNEMKNIPLIEILMKLNEFGVVFGEDYKQLCSPADLMRDLQTEGILRVPFRSIAFGIKEFGDWQVKENVPKN